MAMEHAPFDDVFTIEDGDFPARHVSLPDCVKLLTLPGCFLT